MAGVDGCHKLDAAQLRRESWSHSAPQRQPVSSCLPLGVLDKRLVAGPVTILKVLCHQARHPRATAGPGPIDDVQTDVAATAETSHLTQRGPKHPVPLPAQLWRAADIDMEDDNRARPSEGLVARVSTLGHCPSHCRSAPSPQTRFSQANATASCFVS